MKPSNIRVHEEDYAVLVDFGLSRPRDVGSSERRAGFAGSVGYASPEQVRGNLELGPESDVYSLGATLYHALAGRPAFEAEGIEGLLQAILREEPAPLRSIRPQVPRDLATIVHHAMSKDPRRRYASAHDLAADFEAVLALKPIRARAPRPRSTDTTGDSSATSPDVAPASDGPTRATDQGVSMRYRPAASATSSGVTRSRARPCRSR